MTIRGSAGPLEVVGAVVGMGLAFITHHLSRRPQA